MKKSIRFSLAVILLAVVLFPVQTFASDKKTVCSLGYEYFVAWDAWADANVAFMAVLKNFEADLNTDVETALKDLEVVHKAALKTSDGYFASLKAFA
ncbi:MAG: hypothetical protein F4044_10020 [Rhodobacteraceae bacterium]|nr:hypothetical protein [Paracoccaceae bacterium]